VLLVGAGRIVVGSYHAKASRANDVKRFGCAGSWAREVVLRITSKRVGLLSL